MRCIDELKDNRILIFNQWGQLVYEADNYDNRWKGVTMKGEELPEGQTTYCSGVCRQRRETSTGEGAIAAKEMITYGKKPRPTGRLPLTTSKEESPGKFSSKTIFTCNNQ
ncbi:MAG: gliding motility-associated C-terminal domain-containing protein [Haliscomenobacter sp.]|nr:gliding motility-associated C-terminal domain-containing protein [Haliscomenobacter sp.]